MKLSREQYFKGQRELSQITARAEVEAARRIRAKTREYVLPLVKEYAETRNIIYPVEQLAHDITAIILEEAAKPVAAARKLQDDMEASIAEKLGVKLHHRPEPLENARQRRLENAKEPVGTIIKTPGRGWGYGTTGLASYHRDPQTGKIVWDDLPLEYQFRKRADLSEQVWKAVEEQEQMVFDVIRGGRAAGRNVKDICSDLEQYINKPNGGEIVVGRWMGMFPATKEGIRDAYMHQYVEGLGMQWGSPGAHNILYEKTPGGATRLREGFRQYLDERMSGIKYDEKTGLAKRGSRLPDAVKQYAKRLGKAGLDYRAIRIARDDINTMVSDEQKEIARNSDISSGLVDWVMERGRDAWPCRCEELAKGGPYDVDNMVDKDGNPIDCPLHPNCCCELRPRLKTDEEILAALREEMKDDLTTIEGTDEQKELLEQIDRSEAAGRADPASLRQMRPTIDKALEVKEMLAQIARAEAGGSADSGEVLRQDTLSTPDNKYVPAMPVDRNVNYSKNSFVEASKKELDYLWKRTKEKGHEHMSVMTSGKDVLSTLEGERSYITLDKKSLDVIYNSPANSLTMFQTHTNKTSFSGDDFWDMCKYTSVREMELMNIDGKRYTASIGTGQRIREEKIINDKIDEVKKELKKQSRYAILDDKENLNKYSIGFLEELHARFVMDWNRQVADHFGWIFH